MVGLIFVAQGMSKLLGQAAADWAVRFEHWGYPGWFRWFVGIVEIAGAVAMFVPRSRRPAALSLLVVMAGAIMTHAIHGEIRRVLPPLILGVMLLLLLRGPQTPTISPD